MRSIFLQSENVSFFFWLKWALDTTGRTYSSSWELVRRTHRVHQYIQLQRWNPQVSCIIGTSLPAQQCLILSSPSHPNSTIWVHLSPKVAQILSYRSTIWWLPYPWYGINNAQSDVLLTCYCSNNSHLPPYFIPLISFIGLKLNCIPTFCTSLPELRTNF